MKYTIKDISLLRKLLWLDTLLGGSTALAGVFFSNSLGELLGLDSSFLLVVSIITLCYAIVACLLVNQTSISIILLRILIIANWAWAVSSIGLTFIHFETARPLGKIFLLLQIVVVGGLAYLEGKQLVRKNITP